MFQAMDQFYNVFADVFFQAEVCIGLINSN